MPKYLDLEISLMGIRPKIGRRFLINGQANFLDLHEAIQDACGWEACHLFEFLDAAGRDSIAKAPYADPYDEDDAPEVQKVKLAPYFTRKGTKCVYLYDFGDNWEHLVQLKQIADLSEKFTRRLVDGARAFPPEDSGGVWGYEQCLKAVGAMEPDGDDDAEELEDLKDWIGDWRPEQFDLKAVKKDFDL